MQKHYPTGSAQNIVLKALGEQADNFDHAEAIFAAYGLSVLAVRKGRSSVPSINFSDGGSAFNAYGEGETWNLTSKQLTAEQIEALMPYLTDKALTALGVTK